MNLVMKNCVWFYRTVMKWSWWGIVELKKKIHRKLLISSSSSQYLNWIREWQKVALSFQQNHHKNIKNAFWHQMAYMKQRVPLLNNSEIVIYIQAVLVALLFAFFDFISIIIKWFSMSCGEREKSGCCCCCFSCVYTMGIMRVISHRKSIMCPMGEQQRVLNSMWLETLLQRMKC